MQLSGLEKIALEVFPDETNDISIAIARRIANVIRDKNSRNEKTVLGLATGNTYLDVYRELARMHKEDGLDFSRVVTFNLDEYYGIGPTDVNSYRKFMNENFFNHVNIDKNRTYVPYGKVDRDKLKGYCEHFEDMMRSLGGIDIQLLGIGKDGHIGFNEPGSSLDSRTRLVTLDPVTRMDARCDFGEERYVPDEAITMGVGTILDAREIILMARGDHKALIIKQVVEGEVDPNVPATYLQNHRNARVYVDEAAVSQLTGSVRPWISPDFRWSADSIVKAVTHVSGRSGKPITHLNPEDFSLENIIKGEYTLGLWEGHTLDYLRRLVHTDEMIPSGKNILVFSPHPDDDIISMGGTLRKLAANNRVHVSYMTPGYTAVFDDDVLKFMETPEFEAAFGSKKRGDIYSKAIRFIAKKQSSRFGMPDIPEVQEIKAAIRENEAIAVCDLVGAESHSFLKMPFYKTGVARKFPVRESDISVVLGLMNFVEPEIIYAAADMTDPNGTHRLCYNAINQALAIFKGKPEVWLYRGAWQEYHPSEADAFVPLTQAEVNLKRKGILLHKSQNPAPQPGHGIGEFWERAERRNAETARLLTQYGLGDFVAVEAFKIRRAA